MTRRERLRLLALLLDLEDLGTRRSIHRLRREIYRQVRALVDADAQKREGRR